jgi:hypothetical protein
VLWLPKLRDGSYLETLRLRVRERHAQRNNQTTPTTDMLGDLVLSMAEIQYVLGSSYW